MVGATRTSSVPARELPPAVPPALMSFGDGHHRCPGGPLAIMETEIFLTTLLEQRCGGRRAAPGALEPGVSGL